MKLTSFFGLMIFLLSSLSYARPQIRTADAVDLGQFLGTWYRIAANPIIFEPKCACARQVLSLNENKLVSVYNSCNKSGINGKLVEIRGTAKPIDQTGSKLSVDFGLPWKGSYWIVAVDKDYRYAVVSDKHGYSLYVMSKTPDLSEDLYLEAIEKAKANHVDVSRLKIQGQNGCSYPPEN